MIPYVDEILQSVDKLSFLGEDLSEYQEDRHIGVGETLLCYKLPFILKTISQACAESPFVSVVHELL